MLPEQIAVTVFVADALESLEVHQTIGGSFASALYGVMRATMDADLVAEVAAALSRGAGDASLARQVVQHLARSGVIELVPVSLDLAGRAASIAAEHRIGGCDAVYVALAARLSERLVTLDAQQLERGAAVAETCRP